MQRTAFILLSTFFFLPNLQGLNGQTPVESIKLAMQAQQEAWNQGDIPAFMTYYWNDPQLQFIGAKGPTYGWQNTLKRYQKSYPDQTSMGQLTFDIINVDKRSKKVYSVVGKFHLSRTIGDLEGHFLILWKKVKGKWLIVADCTSS